MPYFIFAWIASALYGLEVVLGKLASKYLINNPWFFNFAWNGIVLILTAGIAITHDVGLPKEWGNLLWASLFYALSGILYVLALYKLDVSVLSPLYAVRNVLVVALGVIVLGEVFSLEQYVLIAVTFVASFFVSLDDVWSVKSYFSKGMGIAMLGMVSLALMALFINKAINEIGFWPATFWIALLSQIMILPTIWLFKQDLKKIKGTAMGALFVMAGLGTAATIAVNKAYAVNIGITSVIISIPLSMILAFLFSVVKPELLEKHSAKVYLVRFIAATVMIIAAIKLV